MTQRIKQLVASRAFQVSQLRLRRPSAFAEPPETFAKAFKP
jgi:hypothetical protein